MTGTFSIHLITLCLHMLNQMAPNELSDGTKVCVRLIEQPISSYAMLPVPQMSKAVKRLSSLSYQLQVRFIAPSTRALTEVPTLDTLTYFLILAGIFRAGYTAFPISPRNSPTAVAHLLTKANVAHLVIENEPALTSLASSALDLLDEDAKSKLETSDLPTYQDFFNPSISDEAPEVEFDIHSTILIVHSSGSTAFPKPIPWSHYTFLQVSSALCKS